MSSSDVPSDQLITANGPESSNGSPLSSSSCPVPDQRSSDVKSSSDGFSMVPVLPGARDSAVVPVSVAPSHAPVPKVGYILYNERLNGSDAVVWSDSTFFRISDPPKVFKPFTPVSFLSSFSSDRPIGKFSVPAFSLCPFRRPDLAPPFVKGSFSKKAFGKVQFTFNPGSLLSLPVHFTVPASSFPSIPFDVELLVQFSVRPPRFSSDSPYPFIKSFRVPQGVSSSLVEPNSNILPLSFIRDLYENPSFNLLLGIGVQENDFLPSLSFDEFCSLKDEGLILWKKIVDVLLVKYKKLASQEGEKKEIYTMFCSRLNKHYRNEDKGVLLYPGRWQNFSGLSLALSLLSSTRLSPYVLSFAHPLTTVSNANELNPFFSGHIHGSHISVSYLFTSPVSVGEVGLDGDVHFGYAHNSIF